MEILHQPVFQIIQACTVAEMDLWDMDIAIAAIEIGVLRHFGGKGTLDIGNAPF